MGPGGSWLPPGEPAQSAYQSGRHDQLVDLAMMDPAERARVLSEARHPSVSVPMAPWDNPEAPIPAADLRATIEAEMLDAVSQHGGEVIQAGPAMYGLVQQLTGIALKWQGVGSSGQPS